MPVDIQPVLPDYRGASIRGIMPALLGPGGTRHLPDWFPGPARQARVVVVLVVDGLGWEQLVERRHLAPNLAAMVGGPITSVAPSTTSTALTSITTGLTPAEHGIIGYRIDIAGEILNVLRWSTETGDARKRIVPGDLQPFPAFLGHAVPVISKVEVAGSAFSEAHLAGAKYLGWRTMSNIAVEIEAQCRAGESVIYAYYDGIDKTAHERGFGAYYDAELAMVDHLIGDILGRLPDDAVLLVTADHGQVSVAERTLTPHRDLLALTHHQSGEGRFRWFHARAGAQRELAAAAAEHHGDVAWVMPAERVLDEAWFGTGASTAVVRRLGDVALVTHAPVSFDDPADTGPFSLVCRHGSLTSAEMWVPFLGATHR